MVYMSLQMRKVPYFILFYAAAQNICFGQHGILRDDKEIGARYERKIGDQQFTLRMNIDNLFNEDYWVNGGGFGIVNVGMPRSINLSFMVDF